MPLDHVQSGSPFRPSARDWNDIVDAVRWVKQYKQLVDGGSVPRVDVNDCRVRLKADTISSALRAGDPVTATSITKIDSRTRWIVGGDAVHPSYGTSFCPWGVCIGPVAVDGWVDVAFAGAVPCYVTISDENHRFVTIDDSTNLCVSTQSLDAGGEIVLKPSGTPPDERLCLVRLGPVARGWPIFRAPDLSGSFTFGASPVKMDLTSVLNDDNLWTLNGGSDEITCNRTGWYRISIAVAPYLISGATTNTLYSYVTRSAASGATSDGVVPCTPLSSAGAVLRDSAIMQINDGDILAWYVSYTGGSWGTVPNGATDFTVELIRDLS